MIDLSSNDIKIIPNNIIINAPEIYSLDLLYGQIKTIHENAFKNQKFIKELDLTLINYSCYMKTHLLIL